MTVFPCTPGGAVERGRRRLRALLLGLAAVLLLVAVVVAVEGRLGAAFVAAAAALVPWGAWRMSGDLDLLALSIEGRELRVEMRRQSVTLPLAGARARALDDEEIAHLERLASAGGLVAGSGGFDSHRLGEFELHATDLRHAVLLEIGAAGSDDEERRILTPDDPAVFLAAVREATAARTAAAISI